MNFLDITNEPIFPGDLIAVAFRSSTQAYLRTGRVRATLDDSGELLVEWLSGRYLPDAPTTKILYKQDKIARLG